MATQYFFITPKKKHTIWAFKNRSKTPSQSGPGVPGLRKFQNQLEARLHLQRRHFSSAVAEKEQLFSMFS